MSRNHLCLAMIALVPLLSAPCRGQSTYTVRDLGLLAGTNTSTGTDVNDNGEVVGNTAYNGTYRNSFYWSATPGLVRVGRSVGQPRLNNLGQVITRGRSYVWKYGENGNHVLALPVFRTGGY